MYVILYFPVGAVFVRSPVVQLSMVVRFSVSALQDLLLWIQDNVEIYATGHGLCPLITGNSPSELNFVSTWLCQNSIILLDRIESNLSVGNALLLLRKLKAQTKQPF